MIKMKYIIKKIQLNLDLEQNIKKKKKKKKKKLNQIIFEK